MAPAQPLVSIVIVNWNTRDLADAAIASVFSHEDPETFEILLVDNASEDGSAAHLAARYPGIRVLANAANEGFARGNNRGAAEARGKYLLLLNSDAYLVEPVLNACTTLLTRRGPCVLGCRILNPDGTLQFSAGNFPTLSHYFLEAFGTTERSARRSLERQASWTAEANRVDWLTGAFLMLEREVYLKLGGLDESIFMYGEDVEFCHRAARAGFPSLYAPGPAVVHIGGGSAKVHSLRSLSNTDRGRIRTMALIGGPVRALLLRAVFLLRSGLRVLANAGPGLLGRGDSRARFTVHFKEMLVLAGIADARNLV